MTSDTILRPPPLTVLRRAVVRGWRDPDTRSVLIGILGVVLIHLLLWLLGPAVLRFEAVPVAARPESTERNFSIELEPEVKVQPQPKPADPFRFVETNPEAPENVPDKTNNFAAQNQQVAQEKPTPEGRSDRPALEGRTDIESNQIVSGRLTQPQEFTPAPPPPTEAPPAPEVVAAPRREQNPLSGVEKVEGENLEGIGSSLAKRLERAEAVPERVEGTKEGEGATAQPAPRPAIDPRRPQPRPQLVKTIQTRPAILAENKFGTTNIGPTAVDARWSNYGAYLQRMIDSVQIQWERIVIEQKANPVGGSSVTVKFVMNDEGRIVDIGVENSTANDTATRACVSAITDRMPYGPWTDDMKAVLGDRQQMTFTFYYQ